MQTLRVSIRRLSLFRSFTCAAKFIPLSTGVELGVAVTASCALLSMRDCMAFLTAAPLARGGVRHAPTSPHRRVAPVCVARPVPGGVTAADGFRAAGATAGFKPSALPDLAVVLADAPGGAVGAGVFTRNLVRAAPVDVAERSLRAAGGRVAAVVVNSGQANASTGKDGLADAEATVRAAAAALGCPEEQVLVASTGMIGVRFDVAKMKAALPGVISEAAAGVDSGKAAAKAIMTTDLVMKEAAFADEVAGRVVTVGGMAKGSGMIHPDMATMLGFVTCDAAVEPELWQSMVRVAADASFNAITVDGDTSTNDVLFALCSPGTEGEDGGGPVISDPASPEAMAVQSLLTMTCASLARQIARDGEGATVLLEVRVTGAVDDAGARRIARAVAGSSLTKAAVHGRDPNWGRIAGAAGRAGVPLDAGKMSVAIGEFVLMTNGEPVAFDKEAASAYMRAKGEAGREGYCSDADTVVLDVGLGDGNGVGLAWGCDLSKEYVSINADYST